MKIISQMNIKSKLVTLFLILCLTIAVLGYSAINISENNKEKIKDIHKKTQIVLINQDKIITPLYKIRELSQSLVMAPNKQRRLTITLQLDYEIKTLNKNFVKYSSNEEIKTMWKTYKILIKRTRKYLDNGFEEGAYVNVTTLSREHFSSLIEKLLSNQSTSLNKVSQSYDNAVNESKDIKVKILIYVLLILALASISGWLVSNNILNSIKIVQNGLNDFFDYLNNKKEEVQKINTDTSDEFAQMANTINSNVANIALDMEKNKELIQNATKVLEEIKGGNLKPRLSKETNSTSLNELKIMMNDMIDNLEVQISNEISQRLEQEQILIQQSKLAAMGEMIGNIAHQWRQPIAQIAAINMNMKVTYKFNKFTKEYLEKKLEESNKLTNYMSQTISDFQNFFNPQGEKEDFSIKKTCEEAYFILNSSLQYHQIEVEFNIIEDNTVLGFRNEYAQVILNILSNAKDILIERKIKKPKIKVEIKTGNNFAIVKIKDNAGGISTDIIDKVFDPYFTTKHKSQGTGIGLYMSKNIIERNMKGFINVKNDEEGAVFTIKVLK